MPSTCAFSLNDTRCTNVATHYLLRALFCKEWTLETVTRKAERGVMHAPEFCKDHAEYVHHLRNAHALTNLRATVGN